MQELIEEASTELAYTRGTVTQHRIALLNARLMPVKASGFAQWRTVELPLHRKPSGPSWIVDLSITDSSRASTPTQGPSTTPLPTFPRRLYLQDSVNNVGCQHSSSS